MEKSTKTTKKKQTSAKDRGEDAKKRKRKGEKPRAKDVTPKKGKKEEEKEAGPPREVWSKSKKKRMRSLRAKQGRNESSMARGNDSEQKQSEKKDTVLKNGDAHKSRQGQPASSLQESFKARLTGSRFRILNEELYTTESTSSYKRFKESPELFDQYHEGFRHQVENWPVNPVDAIVNSLERLASAKFDGDDQMIVADFGCGDAELAKQLLRMKIKNKCPFQVHSFDLVARSDLVTACDMSHVPLPRGSVDVAIFCLALMGTNLADFIREAHRVLNEHGRLKIAEVRSRFETKADKEGKDGVDEFIDVLEQLGFECVKTDRSNKMFILWELKKNGKRPKKKLEFSAKPCIYKRR